MKKKLFILLSAMVFCVCASVGFYGCGDGDTTGGTTDGGTTDTGTTGGNTTDGDTTGGTTDGGTTDTGTTGGDETGGGSASGGTTDTGTTGGDTTEHQHTLVSVAAVAATCTEDGYEAYWQCSDCKKYFADAEGSTEIEAPVTTAALGHEYTTTFNWAQDESGAWKATATRVCSHDAGHTDTVEATVTYTTTSATCTEVGDTEYTAVATFADGLGGATETKEVSGSALGHDYSAAFTFAADYSSATVTLTCQREGCGDVQTAEAVLTSSTTPATCTENGSITYTATYGSFTATETVSIPATGHTYSNEWSYDADAHWHAATCGHSVTSNYSAHTMVQNSNGDFVCSVCGYTADGSTTNYISESGGKLIVGENYITLSEYDADYGYLTTKASIYLDAADYGDGVYTLSIPSGTSGELYLYDADGALHFLEAGDSVSVELDEAQDITIYIILIRTEATSPATLCVSVSYEYKEINYVVEGTESNPRLVSDISEYSTESVTATIAAGESYYFTVATASDTIVSLRYSGSDSAITFYQGSSAITFASGYTWTTGKTSGGVEAVTEYVFLATSTGTTFKITNTSSEEKKVSFDCAYYVGYIVEGSNTINYTSDVAQNGAEFNFYVAAGISGTSYKFTLGSGTTSGVSLTVYYRGELVDTLTLSDNEYVFTNARTSASTVNFVITYTGSAKNVKIAMTAEEYVVADTGADDTGVTYQALTLNEALAYNRTAYTISSVSYQYGFVSYTAAAAGTYKLTLYCTSLASGMEYMFQHYGINVYLNNEAVSGTYNSADNSWNYELTLAAGENKIKIGLNTTSSSIVLTATLAESDGSGSGTTDTAIELALGANTVSEDTLYKFTATTAGTYTFTVSQTGDADSGYTQFYTSSSDWTAYFDQQNGDGDSYTKTFTAGETLYLYVSNGGEGDFIITVS